MQLSFEFWETTDARAREQDAWEVLGPEERRALVEMLARLMAKTLSPKEEENE